VGNRLFRQALERPCDIYEGPAMNHSYHEMIIGHGHCLSLVMLANRHVEFAAAHHNDRYHRAQYLATIMALKQRGRIVLPILLKNLEDKTIESWMRLMKATAELLIWREPTETASYRPAHGSRSDRPRRDDFRPRKFGPRY
jgi:hypothetical protein